LIEFINNHFAITNTRELFLNHLRKVIDSVQL